MRNLVVVRCGKSSLHKKWIEDWRADCGWDLLCVNYDESDHIGTVESNTFQLPIAPTKHSFMNGLLSLKSNEFLEFEYIWFPDDDISISGAEITRFFKLCRENNIALAQPSLTIDSHISHPVTCKHEGFTWRRTNFVEVMAPCFSRAAWSKLAQWPRFNSLSGWGVETYWAKILSPLTHKYLIFDNVSMTHTRPLGGPFYWWLPGGISASTEMYGEMERLNIDRSLGWFRCNIEINTGKAVFGYRDANFIQLIVESLGDAYRRPGINKTGLPGIKFREFFPTLESTPMTNILGHATFGEYLLSQSNFQEWVSGAS